MDPINSYKWINTRFSGMKKTCQQVRNYEVEIFQTCKYIRPLTKNAATEVLKYGRETPCPSGF